MKMKFLAAAAVMAVVPNLAAAQSDAFPDLKDLRATIGVRVWSTDWQTWFDYYDYRHAGLEKTIIPVASVRYKDFLLSGSYLAKKDFHFSYNNSPYSVDRKEYDINIGYFLLPGLAATIGYKTIEYEGSGTDWSAKGPTIGLSGSAPISPAVSVYGNLAYGKPKVRDNLNTFSSSRGKYLLTEVGLAFPLGAMHESMSRVVATVGYRYQRVGAFPAANLLPVELFEYTQGPVAGVSFSF